MKPGRPDKTGDKGTDEAAVPPQRWKLTPAEEDRRRDRELGERIRGIQEAIEKAE